MKSDGQVSAVSSGPGSQTFLGEKVASIAVPGELHINGHKHSPNSKRSASYCDNFSSVVTPIPYASVFYFFFYWGDLDELIPFASKLLSVSHRSNILQAV